jgi:hypothetical protein
MAYERKPLADSQLDEILNRMSAPSKVPGLETPFGARRDLLTFDNHPLYRQMTVLRAFGSKLQLQDPHYRLHDGAAGATTSVHGVERINFASYDYLHLNRHPLILEAATQAGREFGTSVSASRMTAGERRVHSALEAAIARLYAQPYSWSHHLGLSKSPPLTSRRRCPEFLTNRIHSLRLLVRLAD